MKKAAPLISSLILLSLVAKVCFSQVSEKEPSFRIATPISSTVEQIDESDTTTASGGMFAPTSETPLIVAKPVLANDGEIPDNQPRQSAEDFVELATLDPTLVIDLPYASEKNFTKQKLYPVARCFLRREVAENLIEAHRCLAEFGIGIKVWDGYRPQSVQYRMWEVAPKPGFVGDPKRGSKHNRGAAVDVTLVNLATGSELEMPTQYDEFSVRAHSNYLKVPLNVFENRKLLQETMRAHGFTTIQNEWWHFDYRGAERFSLEDIPIETLVKRSEALSVEFSAATEAEARTKAEHSGKSEGNIKVLPSTIIDSRESTETR